MWQKKDLAERWLDDLGLFLGDISLNVNHGMCFSSFYLLLSLKMEFRDKLGRLEHGSMLRKQEVTSSF